MKKAVRNLFRNVFPPGWPSRPSLPPRCRWERVTVGHGRTEWVIVCPPAGAQRNASWPMLYLLHGAGHSPRSFFSLLPMESLLPLMEQVCLVFVEGQNGWYLDSPVAADSLREQAFWRTLEQVEKRHLGHLSRNRRGICGFSMGGFGAVYLAARYPTLFDSASSILGPLDIEQLWPHHPVLGRLLGGNLLEWRRHNPTALVGALRGVRLLATTALDAWDRPLSQSFVSVCRARGLAAAYREYPGSHDTGFVAAHLREHLKFHWRSLLSQTPVSEPSWTIRPARLEDAETLHRNCFSRMQREEFNRHLVWAFGEAAQGRRVHLVAEMGEVVASGELSILGDEAEIANLVVTGPLQNRGLGTALLQALIHQAALRGVRILEIGVRSSDAGVRALYERQGFRFHRETERLLGEEYASVVYLRQTLTRRSRE